MTVTSHVPLDTNTSFSLQMFSLKPLTLTIANRRHYAHTSHSHIHLRLTMSLSPFSHSNFYAHDTGYHNAYMSFNVTSRAVLLFFRGFVNLVKTPPQPLHSHKLLLTIFRFHSLTCQPHQSSRLCWHCHADPRG